MINANMRTYDYFTYGAFNDYGQQELTPEVQGAIKIAIYISTQETQGNINYKDCSYTGLTYDNAINDSFVIKYGEQLLKVLTVNKQGRLKQVFFKSL